MGSELAGHRIEGVIGRGGMGVVYLATHLRLGRRVALKVLVQDLADDDVFRERFIRESQMAAALEHPNIIPIYDAGEVRKRLYISMRHVDGSDLRVWLHRDGALPVEDALSVLEQVASALDAAHGAGLVHRDVKPANILAEDRPGGGRRLFLTDFGITKNLRGDGDSLTRAGQLVGTIDYMAPEQITGQPVDGRADVYSLGCIAYQCLTGAVPYPRDSEVAVMYAHLQEAPPAVTKGRPELPAQIDQAVRRAMAKGKQDRFDTCSEFVEAIGTSLTPTAGGTVGPKRPRPGASRSGGPAAHPTPTRPRWIRSRWWAGAGIAAGIAALTVAIVVAGRHAGAPATTASSTHPSAPPSSVSPSGSTGGTVVPPVLVRLRWKPAPGPGAFGGQGDQVINRALGTPRGIIAVGYDERSGHMQPAVWGAGSQEGQWSWTRLPGPPGNGDQGMAGVASLTANELVAVGSSFSNGQYDAAAWTRFGAGNWARVPERSSGFHVSGDEQMRRVLTAGPGLVAVGYSTSPAGDKDAAAWIYDSGTGTWESRTSGAFGGPGDQEMWSVTSFDGKLFAVGSDSANGDPDATVWWSADGTIWFRVPGEPPPLVGIQVMKTVVAGEGGLVAVGYQSSPSGDLDAAVWASADGMTWSLVPDSVVFGGPGDQQMIGVVTIDRNFVAVGFSKTGGKTIGVVWTSTDGHTWHRQEPSALAQARVQQIKSVTQVGDQLVAVGFERNATNKDAGAWVADLVNG